MWKDHKRIRLTVDGYTRVCLTVIAVLLTVLIIGLWADRADQTQRARAAEMFLDTSAQRALTVQAQEKTNQKLGQLLLLLESGKVKVQLVEGPAKPKGAAHVPPRTPR